MFEIEYKGANCVVISTKKQVVVVDPKLSIVGLKDVVLKDAVELSTDVRFSIKNQDAKLSIDSPGEYGVSDFDIRGIAAQRHLDSEDKPFASTIFRVEVGEVRIVIVGNIYEKLSEDQLEEIGLTDILILPVGGNGYTLDAVSASKVASRIDPKVIIPIHYADKSIKYEVNQDGLDLFVKELGAPVETVSKYKVKSSASVPATLTVIELTRS